MKRLKSATTLAFREKRKADRAERKRRHELCVSREIKPPKNGNGHFSFAEAVRYQPMRLEDCLIRNDSAIDLPDMGKTIEREGEE